MQTQELILEKLNKIEEDLEEIKEHMVDADSIITSEDREARKEHALSETKKQKLKEIFRRQDELAKKIGKWDSTAEIRKWRDRRY